MSTPLKDAVAQIQASDQLRQEFTQDPLKVLADLKVDTRDLLVQPSMVIRDRRTPTPTDEGRLFEKPVCAAVGYYICIEVGYEI